MRHSYEVDYATMKYKKIVKGTKVDFDLQDGITSSVLILCLSMFVLQLVLFTYAVRYGGEFLPCVILFLGSMIFFMSVYVLIDPDYVIKRYEVMSIDETVDGVKYPTAFIKTKDTQRCEIKLMSVDGTLDVRYIIVSKYAMYRYKVGDVVTVGEKVF